MNEGIDVAAVAEDADGFEVEERSEVVEVDAAGTSLHTGAEEGRLTGRDAVAVGEELQLCLAVDEELVAQLRVFGTFNHALNGGEQR